MTGTAWMLGVMALLWIALTGSFTVPNLFLGAALGLFSLRFVSETAPWRRLVLRPGKAAGLTLLFVKELLLSGWRVAVIVTRPRMDLKPGILAFPLTVDRPFEITLLANLITLTPGTLSVGVSADRRTLYVHALDCGDPESIRRDIASGFERRILEAFR